VNKVWVVAAVCCLELNWTAVATEVADVFQVDPLSLLTVIEFVADLPVATSLPVPPSNVGSNVILVPPPDASVNPAAATADHDVPVESNELTTPLLLPLPTPVAIKLRPVNTISVPRTGNTVLAFPIERMPDDQVAAATAVAVVFADISAVATIWLVPSPAANHFRPVNAIPLPCPEKHVEFDSHTVRHVPALPLTSSE
jgi:hypothetical protein